MAGERLADLAVSAVAAYLRASLPATLREVETELGLAAGALADPEAVEEAELPGDHRSPLIEVIDQSGTCDGTTATGAEVWTFDLDVALGYTGNADLVASERRMRQYATAIVRCFKASRTLCDRIPFPIGFTSYRPSAGKRGEQIRCEAVLGVTVTLIDR